MPASVIAVDFDGTITRQDTLHVIVEAHGTRGLWAQLQPRLLAGEITIEEAMQAEFAQVRATPEKILATVAQQAPIRDGFHEFVSWAHDAGHHLVVLSNGFRVVIDAVLGAAGLDHLPVASHDAVFSVAGTRLVWSERGELCELCGRHCKREDLSRHWDGRVPLVYLGDGVSDRCAALLADVVFARDGLAEHLAEQGVPFRRFEDFFEVRDSLVRHGLLAA